MQPNEDNIYAKWLNNELSEEELAQLKESGDLAILTSIISEVDTWELPPAKTSYADFKQRLEAKQQATKRKRLYRFTLQIAASIVLLLVAFAVIYLQYFNLVEYRTLAGQQQEISLPDGSLVAMNGASHLSYKKLNWEKNRQVRFVGQARFEVKKAGNFQVQLPNATVQVLGTKFDVIGKTEVTSVKCLEGKVEVNHQNQAIPLNQGQGFRTTSPTEFEQFDFQVEDTAVPWQSAYTKFRNVPLLEVLSALSSQYNVQFENVLGTYQQLRFTGQFPNQDIDAALNTVFGVLGIQYTKTGDIVKLE